MRCDRRTALLLAGTTLITHRAARSEPMQPAARVIDDLSGDDLVATIGTRWQLVTDRVMGGVSDGTLVRESVSGRPALRMRGDVSLENNGGFVQMALDLAPGGGVVDASSWTGIELDVIGNDEDYGVHLRTDAVERPWQSYRQSFRAGAAWRTVQLAFADFVPHRIEVPLDVRRLRRIGLIAIGRAFTADLAVGGVRFYG
jgi:Complex I intermediate-associated protein 30 (CIA30)